MGYDSEGLKAKAEWIKNLASAIGIVMVVVSLIHEFIYKGQEGLIGLLEKVYIFIQR